MTDNVSAEQLREVEERMRQVNDEALGRSCDEFEFRGSKTKLGWAHIYFRDRYHWVAEVPGSAVSLEQLEAIAAAVRIGRALGRTEGKREVGDYLRRECGL